MDEQKKKLQDNELENVNGGQNISETTEDTAVASLYRSTEKVTVLDPEYSSNY